MRGKRAKRKKLSPREVAQAQLAAGLVTPYTYARIQEKICLVECSSTWGDDIWSGRDRDRHGHFTGSGTCKVRCADCGRKVPPQDVVFDPVADGPVCTDCRTRAPRVRIGRKSAARRITSYATDENNEWVSVEDVYDDPADSSPTTAALDAIADARGRVEQDQLPAEDEAELLAGLAAYQASGGDLRAFSDVTGNTADEALQRQRQQKNAEM